MAERKTQPKPRFPQGYEEDPSTLTAGRYGTKEMVEIWGPEKTFEYILRVQGQAALTLSFLHSDVISSDIAREIYEKANLKYVSAARIRELEKKKGFCSEQNQTVLVKIFERIMKWSVSKRLRGNVGYKN